jgi:hypothetical protein
VRAKERTNPVIEESYPNYSYSKEATSLRGLDLKNGDFVFFDLRGRADVRGRLRRGEYQKHEEVGGTRVNFEWLKPIGSESKESGFAIVYCTWVAWAASTSDFGVIQLLHIDAGHVAVVQQILFDLRGNEKAGANLDAGGALTVRGLNDLEHCCPTGLDIFTFRLKNGMLRWVSYRKAGLE